MNGVYSRSLTTTGVGVCYRILSTFVHTDHLCCLARMYSVVYLYTWVNTAHWSKLAKLKNHSSQNPCHRLTFYNNEYCCDRCCVYRLHTVGCNRSLALHAHCTRSTRLHYTHATQRTTPCVDDLFVFACKRFTIHNINIKPSLDCQYYFC